jgi:hypothetical protein
VRRRAAYEVDPALALEDIEQTIAKAEAIEEQAQAADTRRKRRINRGALPAHLPRIHETVALAKAFRQHLGAAAQTIAHYGFR